jgi:hypothetical protein
MADLDCRCLFGAQGGHDWYAKEADQQHEAKSHFPVPARNSLSMSAHPTAPVTIKARTLPTKGQTRRSVSHPSRPHFLKPIPADPKLPSGPHQESLSSSKAAPHRESRNRPSRTGVLTRSRRHEQAGRERGRQGLGESRSAFRLHVNTHNT